MIPLHMPLHMPLLACYHTQAVQKAVEAVQANWVACSHNKFSFDPESEWVVNIDVGCPDDCQGSLERSRNIALDVCAVYGVCMVCVCGVCMWCLRCSI